MNEDPFASLEACFGDLPDPRVQGRCDHKLVEIILVAVCAVLCGAESWSEVEEFGEAKEAWLQQYLDLPAGIPSHDTFSRVFRLLDAAEFQRRFMRWVEQHFAVPRGQVIALDGKTARGSIVTVDALNCQKDIAQIVVERQADDVFALKAHHPQLHQDVIDWFDWARKRAFRAVPHDFYQTVNKGYGRLEIRRYWAIHDPLALESMGHYQGWAGLQTVVMVERERRTADHIQRETVYYLSSLSPDVRRILAATRAHWSVENTFHWTMDMVFGEDASRVRLDEAPENFAVIRHIAMNLLKQHPGKQSLKRKRFRVALDHAFLLEILMR
jgi:predicted transposase YbfD/YdcC